jgi:hypothetical protein
MVFVEKLKLEQGLLELFVRKWQLRLQAKLLLTLIVNEQWVQLQTASLENSHHWLKALACLGNEHEIKRSCYGT